MKRFLALLFFMCFALYGCGGASSGRDRVPEWPAAMQTDLSLKTDKATFDADWTYGNGTSEFVLRAPQTLSGVTVRCDGLVCSIGDDSVQADLPQQSVFVRLDGAYRALANALVEPQRTGEGWRYDGMDRYGFEALAPPGGGTLQIRFPKEHAEASLTVETTVDNSNAAGTQ
ncbi:MAG: hypothetical protein IJT44_05965 [Clostridia bacterium]|nr:hypothetical protein [Clostridia bacterium]